MWAARFGINMCWPFPHPYLPGDGGGVSALMEASDSNEMVSWRVFSP